MAGQEERATGPQTGPWESSVLMSLEAGSSGTARDSRSGGAQGTAHMWAGAGPSPPELDFSETAKASRTQKPKSRKRLEALKLPAENSA